jgi:putative NADPH-quinone reductase
VLKLYFDKVLSKFAFKFNLRHYSEGKHGRRLLSSRDSVRLKLHSRRMHHAAAGTAMKLMGPRGTAKGNGREEGEAGPCVLSMVSCRVEHRYTMWWMTWCAPAHYYVVDAVGAPVHYSYVEDDVASTGTLCGA